VVAHKKEFELGERKFNMGGKSLNGYEINKLWRNEDGRRFTDVSVASGAGDVHDARSYAACDFDRDGDLDLFIRNYKTDSVFLRNEGIKGHWLTVRPRGTYSNRDAIGTRIEIIAGGRRQVRWISAGSGYMMQQPNEACFGLGDSTKIDMLTVIWPTGSVQHFGGVDADQHLRVIEGQDSVEVLPTLPQPVLPPVDLGTGDPMMAKLSAADIRDLDGNRVDVTKLGGPVLISFWATWCNVCRGEFPDLNNLAAMHAAAGLKVAGITVLDPQGPELKASLADIKPGFPIYTISRETYDSLFGKDAPVPKAMLLDRGRVAGTFGGKIRPYLVKSYLMEALRSR